MIALSRVCYAAAGKKCTAQKGSLAAGVLQNSQVDVVGKRAVGLVAESVKNGADSLPVSNGKGLLSFYIRRRRRVEAAVKRLFYQLRQAFGKLGVSGYYSYLSGCERVAVEHHAICLGNGAAALMKRLSAKLRLCIRRKRHLSRPLKAPCFRAQFINISSCGISP